MIRVRDVLLAAMLADPVISGIATGGIHPHPVRPGTGPNSTPQAFAPDPDDPLGLPQLRPCIVVLDGGDAPLANSPERVGAVESFPKITYLVPDTVSGRADIDRMDLRVCALFDGPVAGAGLPGNATLVVRPVDRTAAVGSDEHPAATFVVRRLRAEFLRRAA